MDIDPVFVQDWKNVGGNDLEDGEDKESIISILQREEYCLKVTLTPVHIMVVYPFHLLRKFELRNGSVTSYDEGEMELYITQDVRLLAGVELWPSEVGVTDPISTSIYTRGQVPTCVHGSQPHTLGDPEARGGSAILQSS